MEIRLKNLVKTFGEVVATDHITLTLEDGKLSTLLGPSGCGKTTLLRLIAGFYYPDSGRIYFDDEDVTDYPPYKRNTGMVFQNYALWPHMTVFDNVAYGLKIRKVPKDEIKEAVQEMLKLVHMEGMENRTPNQLSGGQQQRIALARALVIRPKVLLLDEPLSNLDAKLRIEMREEILRIQRELKITTVYVTHDQTEAMSISDYIAVINKGKVQQFGTPREIYSNPQNIFVSDFIGQCTFIEGVVATANDTIKVSIGDNIVIEGRKTRPDYTFKPNEPVVVAIRPEGFHVQPPQAHHTSFSGKVIRSLYTGERLDVLMNVSGMKIRVTLPGDSDVKENDELEVHVPVKDVMVLPKE